ncbi:2-polyprenylphenol hydroxylase [Arthrobacter sp. CAN_A1]|uniref:2-polyprenylphenol hydroxylase n=1 Tax=Arthrobacter sp. CAN_A1 TaxID=2787717 RepID=UPI0018C90EAA
MTTTPQTPDDDRFFLHEGRKWRRADPTLPDDVAKQLLSQLGRARSAVNKYRKAKQEPKVKDARRRVQIAKEGLGERGTPWWEQSPAERQKRWEKAIKALDDLRTSDEPATDAAPKDAAAKDSGREDSAPKDS